MYFSNFECLPVGAGNCPLFYHLTNYIAFDSFWWVSEFAIVIDDPAFWYYTVFNGFDAINESEVTNNVE